MNSTEDIDKQIEYMEEFGRNKLPRLLRVDEGDLGVASSFFGSYSNECAAFEFNEGERILFRAVARHVKEMVAANGLGYFQVKLKGKSAWPHALMRTPHGLIYGNVQANVRNDCAPVEIDNAQLQKQLFDKANACITKHKEILNFSQLMRTFTLESITVIMDGRSIKGIIKCCYCEEKKAAVRVYGQESGDKVYWIPSNFDKHLFKHHIDRSGVSSEELVAKMSVDSNNQDDQPYELPTLKSINEDVPNDEPSGEQESVIALEVTPYAISDSDSTAMEDKLATQLTRHNLQMMNATAANSERVRGFINATGRKTNETAPIFKVCDIKPDNSCLFGSIAHQLNYVKIDSEQHKDLTRKLRKNVVKYIAENLSDFIPVLKDRLFDRQIEIDDIDKECLDFVTNELSSLKCWGGSESLRAVSVMHKVNIIIVNDDGKSNFAQSYHPCNDRTIIIAFCNSNGRIQKTNAGRNHYNSVVEVDHKTIAEMVVKLIKTEVTRMQFFSGLEQAQIIDLE